MTDTPTTTTAPRRIFHPIQRDAAIFLETTAESGGRRTLIEIELAPGGGNPPHRHLTYTERFEVVEGTLVVHLAGRELELGPGESATVPIGVTHCFANRTEEEVRFRVEIAPGHRGLEQILQIGYGLAADGRTGPGGMPRSPLALAVCLERSDMRIVGPAALMNPLVGLLARIARRRGVDTRLIERYCRF